MTWNKSFDYEALIQTLTADVSDHCIGLVILAAIFFVLCLGLWWLEWW